MPAKTPAKRASARRKPAARKSTAAHKNGNGAKSRAPDFEAAMHAQNAAHEKVANDLVAARDQIAALEKDLAATREAATRSADQLRDIQANLTTRQAELEASRAESQNLKEEVARASVPPPPRLGCPRCGKPMTDYQHDQVRAKRCDGCHGTFFDNGELDSMMKHHDQQAAAGKKGWFSSFFGR